MSEGEILTGRRHQLLSNKPHNGIDELLRASAYAPDFTEGSPARIDDLE